VVTVLNAIYEADFRGFSYGFRPGRNPHQALDALNAGLQKKRVNWVLDADIKGFFDHVSHEWLLKRDLLLHVDQLSAAVEQLAQDCSISPRQAYRYLEQAQQLKDPVPPGEAKLAFTVKLPHSLVRRVRTFAAAKGLSISEVVSRALLALLPRGRGRG
jgi:hypothetical protein